MGIYCCSVADIVIAVVRRLCVVIVRIKARAGWAGVYLKAIVTCVINFLTYVINWGKVCHQSGYGLSSIGVWCVINQGMVCHQFCEIVLSNL